MPRNVPPGGGRPSVADQLLDSPDGSVLDLVDHIVGKGVTATGDVMLGVAGVDLIYLRLSALLCAADRVLPRPPSQGARPRRLPARRRRVRSPGHKRREEKT